MNITHQSALAAATVENYSYLQRQNIYKLQYENKYKYVYWWWLQIIFLNILELNANVS